MDLELRGLTVHELAELLNELGFKVVRVNDDGSLEAKMRKGWGRVHLLAKELNRNEIYVDLHWDAPLHFMLFGVDYAKRPKDVCDEVVKKVIERGASARVAGGTSWFSRKNRAILCGLKL